MALTGGELAAVLEELRARCAGARVKKVYQPSGSDLVFTLGNHQTLLISVHPRFGRIGLVEDAGPMPEKPALFASILRKHLTGAAIEGFDKEPGERLVRVRFTGFHLYCRLYVPGGFLLADPSGAVVAVGGWKADPPLKPGMPFVPPAGRGKEEAPFQFEGSPSGCIEREYREKIGTAGFEEGKKTLLSAIRAERKRLAKLIGALEGDRENLLRYAECKRWGDLCRIHYGMLKRGLGGIALEDPATGETVAVPLSPELGPAENIDLLYKKHRKFKSGIEKIDAAIAAAKEKAAREAERMAAVEAAATPEELAPLQDKRPSAAPAKKKGNGETAFRTFTSADGLEMLVGRNDRENDALVRLSQGNDLWFHLRDFPGSHVVVRTRKKTDVPSGTIVEAARLALKYSSRAKDRKGIVVYTSVKYLRRPKNAPPGRVLVTREKTVQVSLD